MDSNEFKTILSEQLREIGIKFSSMLNEFYQPFGITAVQAMILTDLQKNGDQKISDLSRHLNATASNASVICQRLEKSGLIERIRDQKDQRIVKAVLTPAAREIMDNIDKNIMSNCLISLSSASDEDMQDILTGLAKLSRLLDCES